MLFLKSNATIQHSCLSFFSDTFGIFLTLLNVLTTEHLNALKVGKAKDVEATLEMELLLTCTFMRRCQAHDQLEVKLDTET